MLVIWLWIDEQPHQTQTHPHGREAFHLWGMSEGVQLGIQPDTAQETPLRKHCRESKSCSNVGQVRTRHGVVSRQEIAQGGDSTWRKNGGVIWLSRMPEQRSVYEECNQRGIDCGPENFRSRELLPRCNRQSRLRHRRRGSLLRKTHLWLEPATDEFQKTAYKETERLESEQHHAWKRHRHWVDLQASQRDEPGQGHDRSAKQVEVEGRCAC